MNRIEKGSVPLKKGDLVCISSLTVFEQSQEEISISKKHSPNLERLGIVMSFKETMGWSGIFQFAMIYWQNAPGKAKKTRLFKLYKITRENGEIVLQQALDESKRSKRTKRTDSVKERRSS